MKPNWFVGLPIDPGAWFEPLTHDAPATVRVFHPSDVHLTVAFLGACGEQRAASAWQQLDDFAAAPIGITLGGLEPMGNRRRPSALSAVVNQGRQAIIELTLALRGPLISAAGAKSDERPPLPHVTVARPAKRCSSAQRREAVAWARSKPAIGGAQTLDRIALYSWADDRRVRQFRIVAQHELMWP